MLDSGSMYGPGRERIVSHTLLQPTPQASNYSYALSFWSMIYQIISRTVGSRKSVAIAAYLLLQ